MKAVKRSKRYPTNPARWAHDENKTVLYEFTWRNKIVPAGTVIKLRHDRLSYRFVCLVHDNRLGVSWIELTSPEGYKSVRLERVSQVLTTTKKSRAKKE